MVFLHIINSEKLPPESIWIWEVKLSKYYQVCAHKRGAFWCLQKGSDGFQPLFLTGKEKTAPSFLARRAASAADGSLTPSTCLNPACSWTGPGPVLLLKHTGWSEMVSFSRCALVKAVVKVSGFIFDEHSPKQK